jgi:hypothetical protein
MGTPNIEAFRDWTHENFFTKGEIIKMFSNFNFSLDEQPAGTWIDGSIIYSKVIDLGSDTNLTQNAWFDTGIDTDANNIKSTFGAFGLNNSGTLSNFDSAVSVSQVRHLHIITTRANVVTRYIAIFYIKNSD